MQPVIVDWNEKLTQAMERATLVAKHRLHEAEVFTDAGLAKLLDKHPDELLGVNTMGQNPVVNEWRQGERGGVSGEVLVELLKRGRLWLNLRRVVDVHPEVGQLVHAAYDDLEKLCPGFRAKQRSANLLLSSPHCQVYYHLDAPLNMLWHLRGQKRVWVYPLSEQTVSQENVERVISGDTSEDLPYWPGLDNLAEKFDLQPGEMITWAQHTPHRVVNLDSFNVSLSTEHYTTNAVRLVNVHLANQYFRRVWNLPSRSLDIHGLCPLMKITTVRLLRRWHKLTGYKAPRYSFPTTFRVDPDAPLGIRELQTAPRLAAVEAEPAGVKLEA